MLTAGWIWLIYSLGVTLGAALLAPPIFNVGRMLVVSQWLPALAPFALPVYFRRIVLVLACLGLPIVWRRMPTPPWRRLGWTPGRAVWRDGLISFVAALGSVAVLAALLVMTGRCVVSPREGARWWPIAAQALGTGLGVSVVEETLFRGALLGTLVRSQGAFWAQTTSSLIFAGLHFVSVASGGPKPLWAPWHLGFSVFGAALVPSWPSVQWLEGMATLTCMGLALSRVTLSRNHLGSAIGLHAGWVTGIVVLSSVAHAANPQGLWVSGDFRQGLAPCMLMGATWAAFGWGRHVRSASRDPG